MNDLIEIQELNRIWDQTAPDFRPAELIPIVGAKFPFKKLYLQRGDQPSPIHLKLGNGLFGIPRYAGYRYRMVLIPADIISGTERWNITEGDIAALLKWSLHSRHLITFSTHKSGASFPMRVHAQCYPSSCGNEQFGVLRAVDVEVKIRPQEMPRFQSLEIGALKNYPMPGLRIKGQRDEIAGKVFELALNYDHLKSFNLVFVPPSQPEQEDDISAFFFPRRKDGRAICTLNENRWQIGGLELNGIFQTRTPHDCEMFDSGMLEDLFNQTRVDAREFEDFVALLDTF